MWGCDGVVFGELYEEEDLVIEMGNGGEWIGEKGVLWGDGVDGEVGFCDLLGVVLEDLGSGP